MKIPLHLNSNDQSKEASVMRLSLWNMMTKINPKGFRQSISTGSKRMKPRKGRYLYIQPLERFFYTLLFLAKHGEEKKV